MPAQKDYYEILGVARDASADQIRKAYLKLAHKYHPDKTGGDKAAEERLKEINEAYDTLKNPEKRARYDQFGAGGDPFSGFGGGAGFDAPFEDFFDVLFGRGATGGRTRRRAARAGNDLEYRVSISLKEAALGTKKPIRFKRAESCGECRGTGAAPGSEPERCSECGGTGQVRRAQGFFSVTTTCPACRGRGTRITRPCANCHGSGQTQIQRELTVDLPPGVDTGSRLRVGGEGEPGANGGPRGDLYIYVQVEPHEIFQREGNDIVCEMPISFPQAVLGDTVRVPTLKGEAELKIPAGTQPGAAFRLRGMGIPDLRGFHTGDQIVRVQVEIPSKLTREQRQLIEEFRDLTNAQSYPLHKRFMDKLKRSLGQ